MIAFTFIALLTVGAAAVAMSLRNLIHSVLLLIGSWAGIAAFYLWAGAEFVAFAQVLVYVGAVSMVVLFAVLLTRRSRVDAAVSTDSLRRASSALVAGVAVLSVLIYAIRSTPLRSVTTREPLITVHEIGARLMGGHAAGLLIVGVILTVALLGGVVIAATDRSGGDASRRNPLASQNRKDAV